NIQVAIMRKGIGNYEVFHEENFFEKRGLHPHQIIEFKAFTGDSADNYPGIKGIGEKTALKLLQTYGSMDSILKMKHELTKGIQQKLQDDIDMFELLARTYLYHLVIFVESLSLTHVSFLKYYPSNHTFAIALTLFFPQFL